MKFNRTLLLFAIAYLSIFLFLLLLRAHVLCGLQRSFPLWQFLLWFCGLVAHFNLAKRPIY